MPVLSRFGAQPAIVEKAETLYAEAARETVAALESADDPGAQPVEELLRHLDMDAGRAEALIASMLAKRDQWMRPLLSEAHVREHLEAALAGAVAQAIAHARELAAEAGVPALPGTDDAAEWKGFVDTLLDSGGKWRAAPGRASYASDSRLRHALRVVQNVPLSGYSDAQWHALGAITGALRRALAELTLVFARRGEVDFIELSQAALRALQGDDGPTDLLLSLDYRIRHILVDEFQDTSSTQLDLLECLTSGWEPGDGRTLFVVGDPMQSIYRFRHAEVALFLAAQRDGIGGVPLEPLRLSANFRSQAGVVDWVNASFPRVMAPRDDLASGAVRYAPSEAVHPREAEAVRCHAFNGDDKPGEAVRVAELVRAGLARKTADGSPATVAVLVRSRKHLEEIVPRLRAQGLAFRAIEIEELGDRPVVQDLLALTRALSHLADRTAWLALLRAPWCGLTLADIHALATQSHGTLWEAIDDDFAWRELAPDGVKRLAHLRQTIRPAVEQRRRSTLRMAVESTWIALAGPACVASDTDLEDAAIYLDFLEQEERAGVLEDPAAFEKGVAALFALPDGDAPETLQVMTIHRAKGLEFDTVIVPGLGSGTARDDRALLLWLESVSERRGLLLAPMDAAGEENDPIYDFLRELEKEKARHECERLLYVAATRARRELHLLACVGRDDGKPRQPAGGSLLATLWPAVAQEFAQVAASASRPAPASRDEPAPGDTLVRVAKPAKVELPPSVAWKLPAQAGRERTEIEFSWVGETARRVGSVAHRWLQVMADDALRGWTAARVKDLAAAMRNELVHEGVAQSEVDVAVRNVQAALLNTLDDPRGRWILGPHPRALSEYRLTAIVDGTPRTLIVDRYFEDAAGDTWIVDFKTSAHQGGDLQRFLAEEERRYRAQLEGYAAALRRRGARLGLYFPLLRGWREWRTDVEAMES
jgi:ATP-dependent exoDNAse (exonuclease V) beta subunit